MEEDTPDESVIEKVNARFYEIADGSTVLEKMKEIYHVWMREEEAAIKMLELLIRIAEKQRLVYRWKFRFRGCACHSNYQMLKLPYKVRLEL